MVLDMQKLMTKCAENVIGLRLTLGDLHSANLYSNDWTI